MNGAGEGDRLPPSIGGLIGFALRAWVANVPLFLVLQLGVFAAYAIAEAVVPAATVSSPQGQFKAYVLLFTGLFADALVIAAAAFVVAARSAGAQTSASVLMGASIDRWLPVIAVSFIAEFFVLVTFSLSGLGAQSQPRALQYITAPFVWALWGMLGLAGPFVALGPNRRVFSVIVAFVHAFTTSLHRANLVRLGVLAVITMLPTVIASLAVDALAAHHAARPIFWGQAPVDALAVGPLAALQTAFALDFARRAGTIEAPPS